MKFKKKDDDLETNYFELFQNFSENGSNFKPDP